MNGFLQVNTHFGQGRSSFFRVTKFSIRLYRFEVSLSL